jgi:hypothetical protein
MVVLKDGNYQHVPVDTLLNGKKSVDVAGLYDPATYRARSDARRKHADVPLLIGREKRVAPPLPLC